MKICNKCDERGMIQDSKYSSHSCECGLNNRLMAKIFEDVEIGELLAYGKKRKKEKVLLVK